MMIRLCDKMKSGAGVKIETTATRKKLKEISERDDCKTRKKKLTEDYLQE